MSILVQYIKDVLTPNENQVKFLQSKARSIKNILTKNSLLKPKEICVGGSLMKGTMLKNKLDIDLIYIYNRSDEVGSDWNKLVNIVYKNLKLNFPETNVEEAGKLAIHIKTKLENQSVNIDIVPCYYVNSPKIMKHHTDSKLYQGITTIWHCRYLVRYKNLPYFTGIVRLLKNWKNEHEIPLKNFHLELLVADVYDNIIDNVYEIDNLDEILVYCFENILDTLDGYPVLPSKWKYCNVNNYKEQYSSPVIIDPANPNDNLLDKITKTEIKNIKRKTIITIENLKNGYYSDIFNWKCRTKYFDK
jgi:hypothetical protein